MRKRVLVVLFAVIVAACGGDGGGGIEPIDVNTLDGRTGIPVGSSFRYSFAGWVDASSVTAEDYFIVPTALPAAQVARAAYDETVCNRSQALGAGILCSLFLNCTLDPAADLAPQYALYDLPLPGDPLSERRGLRRLPGELHHRGRRDPGGDAEADPARWHQARPDRHADSAAGRDRGDLRKRCGGHRSGGGRHQHHG